MTKRRFMVSGGHPAFAAAAAILFAAAAVVFARGGIGAGRTLAAAGDPVRISDQALDRVFNHDVAEGEIRAALAQGDTDLAQSFLDLAADRGVAVDPALAGDV